MMDETGRLLPFEEAEPYTTGWAHPSLMVASVAAGEAIAVDGVTGRSPLTAAVPKCPVKVSVEAGSETRSLPFRLDTLVVVAEERRLVARWRAATVLEMRPREVRLARVVMA
jgi:hypothetical protein